MLFTHLFFDLDDTLYPHTTGLWEAIRQRMDLYMQEKLGVGPELVSSLRAQFLDNYGTTLRGLQNHFHVDAQDFLAYVHDLPLGQYLRPNPLLRQVLLSLPQKRWIFTNSDISHAKRVLTATGLTGCFDGIIDVNALDFIPKPDTLAYHKALEITRADVLRSMVFDDAARNLFPAAQLGFSTVLVGPKPVDGVNWHLINLESLPQNMPLLWQNN
jgi:putative hydrolase of the HAD superfamily